MIGNFDNETFEGKNYSGQALQKQEYDTCVFKGCDFSEADLSGTSFMDCEFIDCNISNAKLKDTSFRDVTFKNCKLLGLNFSVCNKFLSLLKFEDCVLTIASFFKLKLGGTKFKNCNLREADFAEADFTASVFTNCDFSGAIFDNTVLEKADFRTSYNFSISPEKNKIKKAKFSLNTVAGLLESYNIEIE